MFFLFIPQIIGVIAGKTTDPRKLSVFWRKLPAPKSSVIFPKDAQSPVATFKIRREFEKKPSSREDHDAGRRKKGVKAKHDEATSDIVKLHYNESLEAYRRSRQLQPALQEYVDCVNRTAQLYEHTGRITSRATMKVVGQEITLKCRDCNLPGKATDKLDPKKIEWRMIPYNEPRDIQIIYDTEKFIFNAETFDLTVTDLTVYDSGRFRCAVSQETVRIYDLQVVESDRTTTTFENSADGPISPPPLILPKDNLQFITRWNDWAPCNECGVKSTRRRVGICTVTKGIFENPIKPVDYPTLNMYGWGLPCRSVLIPRNFSMQYTDQLSRPSEVQIGHCEHPCPTPPPVVFVTDENGKIVDQYERSEKGVYSLDKGPPKLPPLVQRVTAYEAEGGRIRMICPKGSGKSVRWQNCSTTDKGLLCRPVDPFYAEKQSQGRILVTLVNALLIKRITFFDAGIYSCYYDGRLVATIKLHVNPRKNRSLKKIVTIIGIVIAVLFFLAIIIFVVKNT
ncbi:hypothetical protein BV898_19173 [Hypsibius exemplaris]|uniref:Ig-like domain-containing protein n=1 Tax=Hypsibius exemplaris TaxID=2072580 RepID=A0A9X6NKD1_HYPEX|nr:hypothetical protein BV898_19173 [Hypsibius exemplaris]